MDKYEKLEALMIKKFEEHVGMKMGDIMDWVESNPVDPHGPPN